MLANDQRDLLQTKQIPILDNLHFTIMLAGS